MSKSELKEFKALLYERTKILKGDLNGKIEKAAQFV